MKNKIKEIFHKNIREMIIKFPKENWIEYGDMIKEDKPEYYMILKSIDDITTLFSDLKTDIEDRIKVLQQTEYSAQIHLEIHFLTSLITKLQ